MMITNKRTLRVAVAGVAMLSLALAGCSSSTSKGGGDSATPSVMLNVYTGASGAFVENWNPYSPTVLSAVKGMIYEPLFWFNNLKPLSEKPTALLGKDFSWNADGTKLTVTVQDGVKWSDGQPVTAADAAFSFNLLLKHPALNTTGTTWTATSTGSTLELTFPKPSYVDGPNLLATMIVPEHVWKDKADPEKDINQNPIGSGPLKEGTFTSQSYTMVKSPTFRSADKVEVAGERFYSLSGNQAATDKLLAGELDWSGIFIPDMKKVLAAKPNLGYGVSGSQQIVLTTCSSAALGCTGPQTEVAVRQAIAAAIDREQINKLAYYDAGTPISATYGLIGRDDALIAPDLAQPQPMTPNVAKADSLLEAAGWKKGSDGIYAKAGQRLSFKTLVVTGWTDYIATLDTMTQQLKAAGIEMVPQQAAYAEVISSVGLGKYQTNISSLYQGPAADPYYVYNRFFNGKNTGKVGAQVDPQTNVARFSSPIVDAAIAKAAGTQDVALKASSLAAIQQVIVNDMPYIPVLNNVSSAEFNTTRVTGFPSGDNQYASTDPGREVANAQVLLHLKVVKK